MRGVAARCTSLQVPLNESPSEKEGKFCAPKNRHITLLPLNESPSEKEGKLVASMAAFRSRWALNESPSEKEGKSHHPRFCSCRDSSPQ